MWNNYHIGLASLESAGKLRRPIIPSDCGNNGHLYYLLMDDLSDRSRFIKKMEARGVNCVFHYVPLHSSHAGIKYGRAANTMTITNDLANRLVRLPIWVGVDARKVVESINDLYSVQD